MNAYLECTRLKQRWLLSITRHRGTVSSGNPVHQHTESCGLVFRVVIFMGQHVSLTEIKAARALSSAPHPTRQRAVNTGSSLVSRDLAGGQLKIYTESNPGEDGAAETESRRVWKPQWTHHRRAQLHGDLELEQYWRAQARQSCCCSFYFFIFFARKA